MYNITATLPCSHSTNHLNLQSRCTPHIRVTAKLRAQPYRRSRHGTARQPRKYTAVKVDNVYVYIVTQPVDVSWDSWDSLCDTHMKSRATYFSVLQACGFDLSNQEQEEHPIRWDTRSRVRASDTQYAGSRIDFPGASANGKHSADAMPSSLVFGWP